MKKLIALMFAAILSLPAFADSGATGQMGPNVECKLSDGGTDFVPKKCVQNERWYESLMLVVTIKNVAKKWRLYASIF